jgi:hypothetical protein
MTHIRVGIAAQNIDKVRAEPGTTASIVDH